MAWITDSIFSQGDAECDLIAKILGGGKSSRLYQSLVYEKRIAQDVAAQQYSLALGSVFAIEATAKPGVKPEQLESSLDEELGKLQREGPSPAELERAQNTIEAMIIRGLENLGGFGGVADRLNQYSHFLGDPGYLPKDLDRYRKATTESLRCIAGSRLSREARVVVHGVPGQKIVNDVPKSPHAASVPAAAPQIPNQDWRGSVPHAAQASALKLPVPKKFKMPNGLTVLLLEQHSLPLVSANLIVLAGSDLNPTDQPGLASFTADMVDEGTAKRSALQIAADADQIGASLFTGSSMDFSYLTVRSLRKNFEAALELASDVLLAPSFSSTEIDRIRSDRLTQLLQQKDNPGVLAIKTLLDAVYGTDHPYGFTELGTQGSIETITQELLVRFYQSGYVAANSALVVAGDIAESELFALVEKYLKGWKGAETTSGAPAAVATRNRRVIIVEKPGAPQTALRIGHIGAARANPDYVPLDVMNTALGGLFSSRINLNLREKHGYTYGAYSSFAFRRGRGPFVIGTAVRTDVTAPAIAEIFSEMERMRQTEVTPEELAVSKDSLARSLPGLFETTPQSASSIGQLFVYDLPLSFYRELPEQIQDVSAAEVQRAAQKYLMPEQAVVVAVGERSKMESELEKLNLGPIEIRDSSGKPMW